MSAAPVDLDADSPSTGFAVIDLGTLGGTSGRLGGTLSEAYFSVAHGINDAGQVVGSAETALGDTHAFIYTDKNGNGSSDPGEMIPLGTLGGILSEAQDINEAGRVVGYARTLSDIVHAFVYTDKDGDGTSDFGEMIDLGTLGGATSRAYGINEMGQVVGFADTASGDTHAFLYTDTNGNGVSDPGEMVDLGPGDAQAINDAGQVVGSTQTASGAAYATLWKGNYAR